MGTDWNRIQSQATRWLICPALDFQYKIRTNPQGEAKVVVRGKPQKVTIPEATAAPVMKYVKFNVTPQIKTDGLHQDVTDAIISVISMKGGSAGVSHDGSWSSCTGANGNVPASTRLPFAIGYPAHTWRELLWMPGDQGRYSKAITQGGATIKRHLEATDLGLDESVAGKETQPPDPFIKLLGGAPMTDAQRGSDERGVCHDEEAIE